MKNQIRIGTRESQLAVWQAEQVKSLLAEYGYVAELVYIKSEGDVDLRTPLYEMGVQGVFTRSLDNALLNDEIDIAVHSMKDVPTQLAKGIRQAAILKRASHKDLLVYNNDISFLSDLISKAVIATSSIRRKAQWLHRYPNHRIENLRGNVNTRLKKTEGSNWHGSIFAAAGLERINLRPENSIELDWMLPAPAQGAIMVVCREDDEYCLNACIHFNDDDTALCTKIEREFLSTLLGGCSTPISALAEITAGSIRFRGNILSLNGKEKVEIERIIPVNDADKVGVSAADELLKNGGKEIADRVRCTQNMISILSTRPLGDSLIREAEELDIKIEALSFIETNVIHSKEVQQKIENALLRPTAVVFTSMNAVEAVANELNGQQPDWRLYCVGNTTQQLVKKYFDQETIFDTANSATQLAEFIANKGEFKEIIFFCGDKRRDELPEILKKNDIEVEEIIVYGTTSVPHKIYKQYHGILFFSPSAVKSFFSNNKVPGSTILFAIGNTTANELKKYTSNKIIISDEPGKENLFRKMIKYFYDNE